MHIAYILKRYPRFSETFVVNEILAHEAAGVRVTVFALRPPSDTHFQPAIARVQAPVHYLPSVSLRVNDLWKRIEPYLATDQSACLAGALDAEGTDVYQALQLAEWIGRSKISHLHAHFATSATTVARLASRLSGIPYTLTAHAKDIFHESVNRSALEQKLADARALITVSDFNQQFLQREYPRYAAKVHRIYNGIPLQDLAFRPPVQRAPLIVGVGRLVEKKGFDDLVTACALLSERQVPFTCEIIGSGELEPQLRQQIATLRLEQKVRLVGPLPSDQVASAIQSAAVLAAPCITATTGDRDGLPTVLLESMALGTPCVATDVTGIPEIVRDGHTGLLVPERTPERLAEAITRLMSNQSLAQRLASAARSMMEQSFDIEHNTAVQRDLFAMAGQSLPACGTRPQEPELAEVS